jgi:hypothetical protein
MNKPKIYLAKSNKANPDHLISVRGLLSNYGIEVVEYKGGSFSHKPMLECDKLYILPDLSDYNEDEDGLSIGKGLHQQIEEWKTYKDAEEVYMIVNTGDDYYLRRVIDLDMDDYDDYINYSIAVLDYNYTKSMVDYLNKFFFSIPKGIQTLVGENSNKKYKYLLCTK